MAKRIAIAIVTMLLAMIVIYGIFGIKVAMAIKKFSHMKQQTFVSDVAAQQETWQPFLTAVGNLTPVEGVQISNQLAGNVTGIYFQSGQEVKKGQLLVQLNDSSERAQLLGLQAQLQLAQVNYQRAKKLGQDHLISKSDLDTAESNLKQAQSNLDNDQTSIDKKAIRTPFAGRLGLRNINLGQYLAVGANIVMLQSLDKLYATFALPEQNLALLKVGQSVDVTVDAYPGQTFTGKLTAIDSQADPNTHNISAQATIDNPKHLLRAGLFANIEVQAGKPEQVVTVPNSAVDYSLYGSSVFIVNQDGKDADGNPVLKVTQQFVTTGQVRGDRVAITKGLKAGDKVVSAGQQKLHNGTEVEINNSVKPD
ncbi:MAG: efflux RND transporter periplasmic adaptor subunit [Gammaproteobacteria bacterium]